MNPEVSRPEEIPAIILLISTSIVRPFVPGNFVWGLAIVQILLLIRAFSRHDWNTVHLAILLCSLTLFSLIPGTRRWPWIFLMPLLLYWALLQSFRPLRLTATWLRTGHPTLRSEEHTSELQSRENLVCRLLLEKKKKKKNKKEKIKK